MNSEILKDASMMAGSLSIPAVVTGVRRLWEPLRLTHNKPALTNQDVLLIARPDLRHKFIIYGVGAYEKIQILDSVLEACYPEILLPVMYTLENPDKATFITKCTFSAIRHLVSHGLRIKMPDGRTLGMDIILGYVDGNEICVHAEREINQALRTRYEPLRKTLNLDDFKNDRFLRHVYCPISSARILRFVIRCCSIRIGGTTRDNKLSIRELSLRSNGINGVAPLDKYFNYHLAKIDLRHNDIRDIKHLNYFKDYKITELWLDGNPLCSDYTTSEDYVRDVKTIFPHVQRLDGIVIGSETKCLSIVQMNYLGDSSRIKLMKQFIRHFFAFYDQNDRNVMSGLYDHEALFSITLGSITNTTHLQMTKAFASNRNLLKFVDYAKCHEFLLRGPEKIIAALRRQPATHHNYQKFNIDIIHTSEDSMTIAVQGSFCYKEYPNPPLLFNRTFVIVEIEDNEYCIANDQYHIQSESSSTKSIDNEPKFGSMIVPKIVPKIFSPTEKEQLLTFLGERTTMNEEYCRRYLNNANWDIRVALEAFMKAYTVNDVPPEAFKEYFFISRYL